MYIKIKNLEGSDEIFIKYMGLQRPCNNFDGSKVECPEFTRLQLTWYNGRGCIEGSFPMYSVFLMERLKDAVFPHHFLCSAPIKCVFRLAVVLEISDGAHH
jgi:hypothetical protein